MSEEFVVIDPIAVPLKKKKVFPDGTAVIAKIVDARWVQGKFSPGIAVDVKTLSPEIGFSLRTTAYFSKRRDDESLYVKTGGSLDLIQQAVLTNEEFFMLDSVSPETWIGRPLAFNVELVEFEREDGETGQTNYITDSTIRRPTDEELAALRESLEGSKILSLSRAQREASEAKNKALVAPTNQENGDNEDEDFESIPF